MKSLFTLFIILFTVNQSIAQQEKVVKTYIKWIPTSLSDPFAQSLQFSVEHRHSEKYSMNYSLGYITNSNINWSYSNGYRSRISFRKYKNGLQPTKINFFHGPAFIARQMFFEDEQTICITNNCASSIDVHYVELQTRVALTYGYGWQLISNEHLSLELEVLQGIAYLNTYDLGLPPIAFQSNISSGFSEPAFVLDVNGFRPAFHILIKVGFGIPTKE